MKRALLAAAALVLGSCAQSGPPPPPGGWSFAALGDAPYNRSEELALEGVIDEINREELAFVVHVGDLKGGREPCSDELLARRKRQLERIRHPLVVLPGDNEWTDCDRRQAGGFDPLERLDKLRRLFHSGEASLGARTIALERQSQLDLRHREYREHVRWIARGIVFAGVNVPGHNNNVSSPDEFQRRSAAVLDWLDGAAALAASPDVRALVVAMQANPFFWNRFPRLAGTPDGLAALREKLAAITMRLGKPVLLVHGDSHMYTVDRPLTDPATGVTLANFTRVEVFGSPAVNWVKVTPRDGGAGGFYVEPGHRAAP